MTSKLVVLFDAEPLARSEKSGIGYYTQGLIRALAEIGNDKIEIVGYHFSKPEVELPSASNINYIRSKIPLKFINQVRRLGLEIPVEILAKRRTDFIIYPNFIGQPSIYKTPSAVAVHDLTYLEHPEYVSPRNRLDLTRFVPNTIKRSEIIITISESTKASILKYYPWIKQPIVVAHIPPPAPIISKNKNNIFELGITKPYILFVGTLEPRKNLSNLLAAYALLPQITRDRYQLVLAGGNGWNNETLLDEINKKPDGVIVTGYIDDQQKANLYKNAALFVLPSFYEGFGMPILEAQSYGLQVAVSDIEVFHEIAGKSAHYFDENNPKSISTVLQNILSKPDIKAKTIRDNLARFNWQNEADKIYQTILNVVNK